LSPDATAAVDVAVVEIDDADVAAEAAAVAVVVWHLILQVVLVQ